MFIPLKMVLIGIDPYPFKCSQKNHQILPWILILGSLGLGSPCRRSMTQSLRLWKVVLVELAASVDTIPTAATSSTISSRASPFQQNYGDLESWNIVGYIIYIYIHIYIYILYIIYI